jgi:CBS domain-containing protein
MGTAYTPGLTVSPCTTVRKTRRLPLKGQVVAGIGDEVLPETVVAHTEIPGILRTVRASERLGIEAGELPQAARVAVGQPVVTGDLLAEHRAFFGWLHSECRAPVDGTVEIVNKITGSISIRERPRPVEVAAYVRGRVAEVIPGEGVVVETRAALIQGIFGVGGERQGAIHVAVRNPGAEVTPETLTAEMAGRIVVGGATATAEALRRAAEIGIAGLVVGAVTDRDLVALLGYDIGVAITGHEAIPFTLVLTEGFGSIRMAQRTFDLLQSLNGRDASINGATQIRAGVIRPEVIVPGGLQSELASAASNELGVGTPIRIIREPYFGILATVATLPPELRQVPSGALVRVLEADLPDGRRVTVPRANVEILAG